MPFVRCDECSYWFTGNAVGAFRHTGDMPAVEFRREAWERGDWDASWYCIQCYAEHWNCTEKEVMVNLGFSKRQDQKNQYSKSAHAAGASTRPPNPSNPRKPAHITDTRFAQQRDKRHTHTLRRVWRPEKRRRSRRFLPQRTRYATCRRSRSSVEGGQLGRHLAMHRMLHEVLFQSSTR